MNSDRTPPVFPAPPQRWSPLPEILAKLTLLLAEAPEIHAPPGEAAILKELFRALESGQIRHDFILGTVLLPPVLAGLPRDPTDGRVQLLSELWKFVDRHRGDFRHPDDAGSRWIKICEEDTLAHFRAWWRQKPHGSGSETGQQGDQEASPTPSLPEAPIETESEEPDTVQDLDLLNPAEKPPHLPRYTDKDKDYTPATNEDLDACLKFFAEQLGGTIPPKMLRDSRARHWLRRNRTADTSDRAILARFNDWPKYHGAVGKRRHA